MIFTRSFNALNVDSVSSSTVFITRHTPHRQIHQGECLLEKLLLASANTRQTLASPRAPPKYILAITAFAHYISPNPPLILKAKPH